MQPLCRSSLQLSLEAHSQPTYSDHPNCGVSSESPCSLAFALVELEADPPSPLSALSTSQQSSAELLVDGSP